MTEAALATPPARVQRVAFLGTPDAAVPALHALVAAGFDVPVVVTQPDRRRGRGSQAMPSAVKASALDLGLRVSHDLYDLVGLDLDAGVVVAYGRLLRRDILEKIPMINVHFSLLPRWRGAAPVERAILAGDTTTGVCVMGITEGLDEGPLYRCVETDIGTDESAAALTARLADLGAQLLVEVLSDPITEPTPQTGTATHAAKVDRAENRLDFSLPAVELHRRVRIGRAWTTFRSDRFGIDETRLVGTADSAPAPVTDRREPGWIGVIADENEARSVVVATGDGSLLRLVMVKQAGKRAMPALDWWNGAQPAEGEHLGR